jgi:hypothetical protein
VLLYVTGGLATARLESNYALGFLGFPTAAFGSNRSRRATRSVAASKALSRGNWTAKAEYLFMDLGCFGGGTGAFASATVR